MNVTQYLLAQTQSGILREDTTQINAAGALDELLGALKTYSPKRNIFGKRPPAPNGLYLWGSVGRGKSMLMDVFYNHIDNPKKIRVHFHEFMQDTHRQIASWRKLSTSKRRQHENYVRGAGDDPIAPTAKAIARSADIICFDEFQVTDIADAMILSRLFSALFARGVVVIATSNRAPDALYKDGLNRGLFLPFIDLLKQKLDIFDFDGDTDHRLRKLKRAPVYYTPLGDAANDGIEKAWRRLIRPAAPSQIVLNIQGRKLTLLSASGIARSNFNDLCERPLGAADYLAIAQHFNTVILENIPVMGPDQRNAAKRFVTLIDALYEAKTNLILSAAAPAAKLYTDGDGGFEFARTASRLMEMQSVDYLAAPHKPS